MPTTTPRQRKTTGRVMHEFKHGELKSGRGGKGARSRAAARRSPLRSKRPALPGMRAPRQTSEISQNRSARKCADRHTNRKRKGGAMSARTGGAKAAAPWAARMRRKRQPAAARPQGPGPAAARARRQAQADKHQEGNVMIRKLKSGEYRLYSRNKNPKRRNLGTFSSRQAAEKHERAVQFFKRGG